MHIKQQNDIPFTVRTSSRARHMRLAVYCDGSIVLTAPRGTGTSIIAHFFEEKRWWVQKQITNFRSAGLTLVHVRQVRDYTKRKEEARQLVLERIAHYETILGVTHTALRIGNQKTCWGSCSRKGTVSINYKILHLTKELQEYIIVHELCHLKEFNHSKRFWAHVESVIPNHHTLRTQLRKLRFSYR